MDYFPYIGFGVMTVLYLLERFWSRKDLTKVFDRILVLLDHKSFEAHQYYEKKYPRDLKELDKIRKEERNIRKYEEKDVFEDDSIKKEDQTKLKKVLKQYGSDWGEDEVDAETILEMERERLGEIKDDNEGNDLA